MSQLGWKTVFAASEPIGGKIEQGRPRPVIAGVLIGIAAGVLVGYRMWPYTIGITLAAGLVGGLLAAVLFPAPPAEETESADITNLELPETFGEVQEVVQYRGDILNQVTILTDRILYCTMADVDVAKIRSLLSAGKIPTTVHGDVLPIDKIQLIESDDRAKGDPLFTTFRYEHNGLPGEFLMMSNTAEERDAVIRQIESSRGKTYDRIEIPAGLVAAFWAPVTTLVLLMGASFGLHALAKWQLSTLPQRRQRDGETDPVDQFFESVGPTNILFAGLFACVVAIGWIIWRVYKPPMKILWKNTVPPPST